MLFEPLATKNALVLVCSDLTPFEFYIDNTMQGGVEDACEICEIIFGRSSDGIHSVLL